jgi:hypothetical protein
VSFLELEDLTLLVEVVLLEANPRLTAIGGTGNDAFSRSNSSVSRRFSSRAS